MLALCSAYKEGASVREVALIAGPKQDASTGDGVGVDGSNARGSRMASEWHFSGAGQQSFCGAPKIASSFTPPRI